ncbi:MAG: hypothetical protein ABH851_00640 [Methanobacteriota archaeon]
MEKQSHFQPYGSFIDELDILLGAEVDKLGVGDIDWARQVNEWLITQTLDQMPIPGVAQEYWKRVDSVARVMDDSCPDRIQDRYQKLKEQE